MWFPLLILARAFAQEVAGEPAGAASPELPVGEAAPVPPPRAPVSLAAGFVWSQRALPDTPAPLTGLAIEPAGRVWLVAAADGSVFRSPDAGESWSEVLPRNSVFVTGVSTTGAAAEEDLPSDEERVMEAEDGRDAEVEDLAAGLDVGEGEVDPATGEALPTDVEGAAGDLTGAVRGAVSAPSSAPEERASAAGFATVWIDPLTSDLALVGRADGTWRSTDGGQSWTRVDATPGTSAFLRADQVVLAGGNGLRASLDGGRTWIVVEDLFGGVRVNQLADGGSLLYAATNVGLFTSRNALQWSPVVALGTEAVAGIVPDPDWPGGAWVPLDRGLLRTDDGGASFFAAGRQPIRALRRVVHLGAPGHLLAISAGDGVWESRDGGVRWESVNRLLTEPEVHAVAFLGGRPVIATRRGVWELVAAAVVREDRANAPVGLALGSVVDIATHRVGLASNLLAEAGRATAYRLAPSLEVTGAFQRSLGRESEYLAQTTDEERDRQWNVTVRMCWGACGELLLYETADDLTEMVLEDITGVEFYVVGEEVYLDDGGSIVSTAANAQQTLTNYRVTLASQVADAWLARRRLVGDTPLVAEQPLREQLLHTLKVQELDAHLDAWTDGAWSTSLLASPENR